LVKLRLNEIFFLTLNKKSMKKLLLMLLMLVFTLGTNAQELATTHSTSAEYVQKVEGKTKNEIFSSINKWVALNYNSAINVVQLSDNEGGVIIVKGTNSILTTNISKALLPKNRFVPNEIIVDVNHVLDIMVRDGRYKITYTITSYRFNLDTEAVDDELMTEILKPYYDMAYVGKKKEAKYRELVVKNTSELKLGILTYIKKTNESVLKSVNTDDDGDW
jgi:hypothetical protein